MRDKITAPPTALICGECFERQRRTLQGQDDFYCEHNQVWAIRRPDGGWLLSTDISPEDHRELVEDARRLQVVDESGTNELLVAARIH